MLRIHIRMVHQGGSRMVLSCTWSSRCSRDAQITRDKPSTTTLLTKSTYPRQSGEALEHLRTLLFSFNILWISCRVEQTLRSDNGKGSKFPPERMNKFDTVTVSARSRYNDCTRSLVSKAPRVAPFGGSIPSHTDKEMPTQRGSSQCDTQLGGAHREQQFRADSSSTRVR